MQCWWVTSLLPVKHILFHGEDMYSRWFTPPFPVRMFIPLEFILADKAHSHRNEFMYELIAFPVSHIPISGKDVHYWWVTSSLPERHIFFPGEDMYSRWFTPPFPVRMFIPLEFTLTEKAHFHREWVYASAGMKWGCASPRMHILTRNGGVPHRKCTSSTQMQIVYTVLLGFLPLQARSLIHETQYLTHSPYTFQSRRKHLSMRFTCNTSVCFSTILCTLISSSAFRACCWRRNKTTIHNLKPIKSQY